MCKDEKLSVSSFTKEINNELEELIIEESAKIIQKKAFYNPAQKTNRDISVLVIKKYFKDKSNIKILDAMSATGLRGIRYIKEIESSQVFLNDINTDAIDCILKNLAINKNKHKYFENNLHTIRKEYEQVNVIKSDCNVLMCTLENFFDVIDIDPFGSCSTYIENAFRAVKHNGIICFTSTDKGVLVTNEKKCSVKYDTVILKKFSQNEMAIRGLLSCISRHAAKFGISIEPLISLNLDFYLRLFIKVRKRNEKRVVLDNSLQYLCNCGVSKSTNANVKPSDVQINFQYLTGTTSTLINDLKVLTEKNEFPPGNICNCCYKAMKICGPFWNKSLHCREFISKIIASSSLNDKRIIGIFNYLNQELSIMWYYEMGNLCKNLKLNCIKIKNMLTALKNLGYDVSLTHCDINAFKTNASLKVIQQLIKIGNFEESASLFVKNDYVEKLCNLDFYKGKIASKMGPLALPK